MTTLHKVTALVDWDTARRVLPRPEFKMTNRHLENVIAKLQDAIANYLHNTDSKKTFRVQWRIYHGWYRGKTKTDDRRLFENYILAARSRTLRSISFSTDFKFGDTLCCNSSRNPLFDTLRRNPDTGNMEQKMVDTALACDLLHLVRSRDSYIYIIVASDDDIIPALFTAESWQANVVMLHNRANINSHLRLNGLVTRMDLRWI
jgi:hypothetical protein